MHITSCITLDFTIYLYLWQTKINPDDKYLFFRLSHVSFCSFYTSLLKNKKNLFHTAQLLLSSLYHTLERLKQRADPTTLTQLKGNCLEQVWVLFMERTRPRHNSDGVGLLSCWGRLKLKLPWRKGGTWDTDTRRQQSSFGCNIAATFRNNRRPKPAGGFRYDPLSYSQNFDEGFWDDDDVESLSRGFSSRYAPPSKVLGDKWPYCWYLHLESFLKIFYTHLTSFWSVLILLLQLL